MPKLTDTQLIVLSKAAQREDGAATQPQGMTKAALVKLASILVDRKLVREVRTKSGMPVWRVDDDGRSYSLVILRAGREAISLDGAGDKGSDVSASAANIADKWSRTGPRGKIAQVVEPPEVNSRQEGCRAGSKLARLVGMLERADGATVDELMAATDWLAHTTRAALTSLRKRGYELDRQRSDGMTRYRIKHFSGLRKAA